MAALPRGHTFSDIRPFGRSLQMTCDKQTLRCLRSYEHGTLDDQYSLVRLRFG